MAYIGAELQARALALDAMLPELVHRENPAPGVHCKAAAGLRHLVDELVHCAVLADREAGATWADIGRHLGIGADAARHRYGRLRLLWPPPEPEDADPTPPRPPEGPRAAA
ncbi:hypothetical protein GT354_19215 [Streptomyces sp. SID3343]|nr:hypothetical protein [Streptomyces sp. SID3343]